MKSVGPHTLHKSNNNVLLSKGSTAKQPTRQKIDGTNAWFPCVDANWKRIAIEPFSDTSKILSWAHDGMKFDIMERPTRLGSGWLVLGAKNRKTGEQMSFVVNHSATGKGLPDLWAGPCHDGNDKAERVASFVRAQRLARTNTIGSRQDLSIHSEPHQPSKNSQTPTGSIKETPEIPSGRSLPECMLENRTLLRHLQRHNWFKDTLSTTVLSFLSVVMHSNDVADERTGRFPELASLTAAAAYMGSMCTAALDMDTVRRDKAIGFYSDSFNDFCRSPTSIMADDVSLLPPVKKVRHKELAMDSELPKSCSPSTAAAALSRRGDIPLTEALPLRRESLKPLLVAHIKERLQRDFGSTKCVPVATDKVKCNNNKRKLKGADGPLPDLRSILAFKLQ